jgi:hypothetical protein
MALHVCFREISQSNLGNLAESTRTILVVKEKMAYIYLNLGP